MTIQLTRRRAFSWILFQVLVLALVALAALLRQPEVAKDLALGGLTAVLPNLLFALILFAVIRPTSVAQMLVALYVGETLKLLLTGCIFLFVLYTFTVKIGAVLAGMVIAILAFWLAPLVMNRFIGK